MASVKVKKSSDRKPNAKFHEEIRPRKEPPLPFCLLLPLCYSAAAVLFVSL